jgi:dihydrofolate synthase/folylpolyglutamate synthase
MPSHHLTTHLQRLYRLHAFGIKFGLEAEQALLGLMGNPERGMKIIHVAGTNGKGSVCALTESVLRAAGFKTGLYTSPHLVRVNERIKVSGEDISDDELVDLIELVDSHAASYAQSKGGREITFFEFLTALAFKYFHRQKVDVAVLETGMGGRLDATNVITPQLAVITGISMEHTAYLGTTLEAIAAEKGGIIKPNVPVVIGALPEEALRVVTIIAEEKNARIIRAHEIVSVGRKSHSLDGQKIKIESADNSYGTCLLPLLGSHQLGNTAIAVAALEEFCRINGLDLAPSAVKKGLSSVMWPGRLQVISKSPVTIVDGAHNPEAAGALNKSLKELFQDRPVYLILGMCSDKDTAGFVRNITVPVKHCWLVQFSNERSILPDKLKESIRGKGWSLSASGIQRALAEAGREALQNDGIVCITGSLYLAGEIMHLNKN